MSALGHITSFVGSDTVPVIGFARDYYNAKVGKELIACSVPATEHSVMCAHGKEDEIETFRYLIEDLYPTGIVSIVSDTWDFWKVLNPDNGYLVQLKDKILARKGKVVIRPDTGDPVKIVIGDPDAPEGSPAHKGAIRCLYEIFGGTKSSKGYIKLNEHIGLIYGDSITLERAEAICEGLAAQGFASTNIVFGIGSYTYQYVTRDTDGYAVKATWVDIDGEPRSIFKDPATGDGTKKSAKGLIAVFKDANNEYYLKDEATIEEMLNCELIPIFRDGKLLKDFTLEEVRENIRQYL
jgi:nicotinamide phosphoribosyltransferase